MSELVCQNSCKSSEGTGQQRTQIINLSHCDLPMRSTLGSACVVVEIHTMTVLLRTDCSTCASLLVRAQ